MRYNKDDDEESCKRNSNSIKSRKCNRGNRKETKRERGTFFFLGKYIEIYDNSLKFFL